MENNTEKKKLYRSKTDRVIGGIAGGMADYFKIDSLIIRIIFIVIALVSQVAPAVIAYLIAMIVIPKEGQSSSSTPEKITNVAGEFEDKIKSVTESFKHNHRHRSGNMFGFILIIVGLLLLINQILPWYHVGFVYFWPIILIVFGLYFIFRQRMY
jgi:phage shock protein C